MKRILSLALICVILVASLAPNVAAAESDESEIFELLDFCMPNGYDSTKVWLDDSGVLRTAFSISEAWQIEYVDVIFTIPEGRSVTGVKLGFGPSIDAAKSLTVVNVSGNIYRAYGKYQAQARALYIWVQGSANWVVWQSVRVSTTPLTGYDEKAQCIISAMDYYETINYVPTDLINYRIFTGYSSPTGNSLDLWISCDNWRKYDYLDFIFSLDISAVNSITVTLGDSVVPCDISYLDNGGTILNHFSCSVRLDLRGLDRTSSEGLILHVLGQVNSGEDNVVSMDGCRGFIRTSDLNADVVWYKRFYSFLKDEFYFNIRQILEASYATLQGISSKLSASSSSGDAFKEDSAELITGLDDISASMDSVQRPSMDSINADFTGDISDASVLMAGLFSVVTSIPWFATIILASCTIGLISYILYGKD